MWIEESLTLLKKKHKPSKQFITHKIDESIGTHRVNDMTPHKCEIVEIQVNAFISKNRDFYISLKSAHKLM